MKKLSLSLLCSVTIFCTSCSKEEDQEQQSSPYEMDVLIGEWSGVHAASFTYNKDNSDTSFYGELQGWFGLTFEDDGAYEFHGGGETAEGTFEIKGTTLHLYGEASSTHEILVLNSTDLKLEEIEHIDGSNITKTIMHYQK